MRFFAVLLGLVCAVTGFAVPARYSSKKDHFSLQLPPLFNKPKIHREPFEGGFSITMVDSMGSLFQVEQVTLAPSSHSLTESALLSGLGDRLIAVVEQSNPPAKCVEQQQLKLSDGRLARYFLFACSNASLLKDRDSQEKFDSMRGMLLFRDIGKCVVLSYQTDLSFTKPDHNAGDMQKHSERYMARLIESANSYRIEPTSSKRLPMPQ